MIDGGDNPLFRQFCKDLKNQVCFVWEYCQFFCVYEKYLKE